MNRRDLLKMLGAAPLATAEIAGIANSPHSASKQVVGDRGPVRKPNILFALADDWSWPHAGIYGDRAVQTPVFDRIAREGMLFTQAYCAAPSCTPSRAGILTGQAIHRLEDGANLYGILPSKFRVFPDLLEAAGYRVGYERKGWAPGAVQASGRKRNPAGPQFRNFDEFLKQVPDGSPFYYWFGSTDPHRDYQFGSGIASGMKVEDVLVPPSLPDCWEVRSDILDYYFAVQRFDRDLGRLVSQLETRGILDDTIVVVTSDNGLPFPRAKANVYDGGTRMPLAIRWPAMIKGGQVTDDFVHGTDFAPTFLEAAGLPSLSEMTGRSLMSVLTGEEKGKRDRVFLERERHANCREGNLSYPMRAIRTSQYLYVRNLRPDRWPGGDPKIYKGGAVGIPFGDSAQHPSTTVIEILHRRLAKEVSMAFRLAFEKRPAEELYDMARDPMQMSNVANRPEYAAAQRDLRVALDHWMSGTDDPRAHGDDDSFDKYPYFGPLLGEPFQEPR